MPGAVPQCALAFHAHAHYIDPPRPSCHLQVDDPDAALGDNTLIWGTTVSVAAVTTAARTFFNTFMGEGAEGEGEEARPKYVALVAQVRASGRGLEYCHSTLSQSQYTVTECVFCGVTRFHWGMRVGWGVSQGQVCVLLLSNLQKRKMPLSAVESVCDVT